MPNPIRSGSSEGPGSIEQREIIASSGEASPAVASPAIEPIALAALLAGGPPQDDGSGVGEPGAGVGAGGGAEGAEREEINKNLDGAGGARDEVAVGSKIENGMQEVIAPDGNSFIVINTETGKMLVRKRMYRMGGNGSPPRLYVDGSKVIKLFCVPDITLTSKNRMSINTEASILLKADSREVDVASINSKGYFIIENELRRKNAQYQKSDSKNDKTNNPSKYRKRLNIIIKELKLEAKRLARLEMLYRALGAQDSIMGPVLKEKSRFEKLLISYLKAVNEFKSYKASYDKNKFHLMSFIRRNSYPLAVTVIAISGAYIAGEDSLEQRVVLGLQIAAFGAAGKGIWNNVEFRRLGERLSGTIKNLVIPEKLDLTLDPSSFGVMMDGSDSGEPVQAEENSALQDLRFRGREEAANVEKENALERIRKHLDGITTLEELYQDLAARPDKYDRTSDSFDETALLKLVDLINRHLIAPVQGSSQLDEQTITIDFLLVSARTALAGEDETSIAKRREAELRENVELEGTDPSGGAGARVSLEIEAAMVSPLNRTAAVAAQHAALAAAASGAAGAGKAASATKKPYKSFGDALQTGALSIILSSIKIFKPFFGSEYPYIDKKSLDTQKEVLQVFDAFIEQTSVDLILFKKENPAAMDEMNGAIRAEYARHSMTNISDENLTLIVKYAITRLNAQK